MQSRISNLMEEQKLMLEEIARLRGSQPGGSGGLKELEADEDATLMGAELEELKKAAADKDDSVTDPSL